MPVDCSSETGDELDDDGLVPGGGEEPLRDAEHSDHLQHLQHAEHAHHHLQSLAGAQVQIHLVVSLLLLL